MLMFGTQHAALYDPEVGPVLGAILNFKNEKETSQS